MPLVKANLAAGDGDDANQASFALLVEDLAGEDANLRRSAARRLAQFPEAADVLYRAATNETHVSVREAIFNALIRIGTKPVAAHLVELLHSEDAGLRNAAVEALKTMPALVGDFIDEIFAGPLDVRVLGVDVVGGLASQESPVWLIRVIETDPALNVCAAAVDALAECGDRRALEPLQRLLDRFPGEPYLDFTVRVALKRILSAA